MSKITFTSLFISFTLFKFTQCDSEVDYVKKIKMYEEGLDLSRSTLNHFYDLFNDCIGHSMAQKYKTVKLRIRPVENLSSCYGELFTYYHITTYKYLIDNLPRIINWPARTTVGLAPKFSFNRKFFANMIKTTEFHEMLAFDEKLLRSQWVKKMKYCDGAVMDQDMLRDFYDREVDQAKA